MAAPEHTWVNSLTHRRFQINFRWVIFKLTLVNGGWGISHEIAPRWMPLDLTDDKSTLVQVMAWCRQATSHYLSQCWPRSMSPNGVTRPQWVNSSVIIGYDNGLEPSHQLNYCWLIWSKSFMKKKKRNFFFLLKSVLKVQLAQHR